MLKSLFNALMWLFALLLLAGVVLRLFFVDIAVMGHNAMAPTLLAGNQLLVWRQKTLHIGDVAVCQHPQHHEGLVIGRVVGRAGSTLRSQRHQLVVDDRVCRHDLHGTVEFTDPLLQQTHTMQRATAHLGSHVHSVFLRAGKPWQLPKRTVRDGLFLLSDNRHHPGQDSRAFGVVYPNDCIGRVLLHWGRSSGQARLLQPNLWDWVR